MSKCNKQDCKHFYESNIACCGCPELITLGLRYEPKTDPLKNIFKDAPVMVRDGNEDYKIKYYSSKGHTFDYGRTSVSSGKSTFTNSWCEMRLPTIAESPRNVWLAAPADGKCPEGAENLMLMTWIRNFDCPHGGKDLGKYWEWTDIEKFMIIDKEAFDG